MICHCCCRGKLPMEGFATMWRLNLINGKVDRVYDRGANSLHLHAVIEGGERYIYECGLPDGSDNIVTKWHDGIGTWEKVWSHPVSSRQARRVVYQPADASLWLQRFTSLGASGTIERLDASNGSSLNTVSPTGLVTSEFAYGPTSEVTIFRPLGQVDSSGVVARRYNSSLAQQATITIATGGGVVPLGAKNSPSAGASGFLGTPLSGGFIQLRVFNQSLSQTSLTTTTTTANTSARPECANTAKAVVARNHLSPNEHRMFGLTSTAADWNIAQITGTNQQVSWVLDSDNTVYVSSPSGATQIARLNAATGATVWTYTDAGGAGGFLLINGDRLLSFGGTAYRVRALDKATGSLLWKSAIPHFTLGGNWAGMQVLGQYLFVCGERTEL